MSAQLEAARSELAAAQTTVDKYKQQLTAEQNTSDRLGQDLSELRKSHGTLQVSHQQCNTRLEESLSQQNVSLWREARVSLRFLAMEHVLCEMWASTPQHV